MPGKGLDSSVVLGGSLIGAAALTYYMTRKDKPVDPLYDFENQSVEIDEKEHVRVCSNMVGKPLTEFRFDDVKTIYDVLQKGLAISSDGPCLGEREGPGKGPFKWIKYSEVIEKVRYIGSGLVYKGIESTNQTNIGIYASNRNEWIISEHACYSMSFAVVSLYDSYGKESIKYILNHAELKAIFVDKFQRIMNILDVIEDLPYLKLIVHFDEFNSEQAEIIKPYRNKIEIVSFHDLLNIGRSNLIPPNPPKTSDVATVCYTSGTTGAPKGALLTHLNIIANEAAIYERLSKPHLNFYREKPPVVHMSYLPLAHMLERQASMMVFLAGGRLGFLSGDITTLLSDAQELKPTDFPIVPRLLNRLYNSVKSQLKGSTVKQLLFNRAIAAKEADRQRGIYRKDTLFDKLVFNKIREKLGGNICRMATGSAPISDEVMIFSKAAFSCPIPEGYGQTEATCSVTFCHPFDVKLGHCGPPVSCYMVKLVDVPDMEYFSRNNQGEICCKGPSRFKGYLKDEERTAEVIDADGWLHTGDIGMWLPGEYISPEKVENVYLRSQFIAQILVEGNSLKDFVVAVVVPDAEYLIEFAKKIKISGNMADLCKNSEIKKAILSDMEKLAKSAGLMSYEKVKNVYLHPEMMTLENGLATPTMKIKRLQARKFFEPIVQGLYQEMDVTTSKL